MRKHHAQNERIKRQYFAYLEEAKRMSKSSVDQVAATIAQFEASTGHRDFRAFHIEQARKFKRDLADAINPASGKAQDRTFRRIAATSILRRPNARVLFEPSSIRSSEGIKHNKSTFNWPRLT
jgi:hypothetical protein